MSLSIRERIVKHGKVFVRNMTTNPDSTVVINFRIPGRQKPRTLMIPPSKYPYEIYPSRVSKTAMLEGSDELLNIIETGRLRFVKPEAAERILAKPEVRQEVESLMRRTNSNAELLAHARQEMAVSEGKDLPKHPANPKSQYISGPGAAPRVSLETPNPIQAYLQGNQQAPNNTPSRAGHQLNIAGMSGELHPRVIGLIAGFEPSKDAATLARLQALSSQIKRADLHEIVSKTPSNTQTNRWARKKLRSKRSKR
jgi:hypothetical protein